MRKDRDRSEYTEPQTVTKKTYGKPRIEDYGSVVELTGSGGGSIQDGAGPTFSGAAG